MLAYFTCEISASFFTHPVATCTEHSFVGR